MKNFKLYSVYALIVFVIIFIIQNLAIVEIKFLFWSAQMSRSIFMLILLLIGIIVGWLLHSHFKQDT